MLIKKNWPKFVFVFAKVPANTNLIVQKLLITAKLKVQNVILSIKTFKTSKIFKIHYTYYN